MSSEENTPGTVVVRILDKEYQVSCPPSEQEALLKSARYLDENMRKIKARGNIHGLEKISVMAALNITHEMLSKSLQLNENKHITMQQVKFLEDKIDRSLQANRQIEIT
ncbi:MAG: cell division protein ZapA [Gammaproteobacteria bacterium]|nr:cell division protein ZapA [Gammaproteobacteria bacterium]MDP2141593.1 cell division protein ZapA [Gammaproteobacteria bacterium]MDP2346652.1 cell division protein ZapA [Gammaproteobacteria bacterium]